MGSTHLCATPINCSKKESTNDDKNCKLHASCEDVHQISAQDPRPLKGPKHRNFQLKASQPSSKQDSKLWKPLLHYGTEE